MNDLIFYTAGGTKAITYAAGSLRDLGASFRDTPSPDVTHLLLDVPSFGPDGKLRSGEAVEKILNVLPPDVTIVGGNLNHRALGGHRTLDLLQDANYLAQNAAITAHCAVKVALPYINTTLQDCTVLIVGWGRIGKCLAQLLRAMGASVSIFARKEADTAILSALGYHCAELSDLSPYRIIFNTAPEMVLTQKRTECCHPECVKIELASKPGIEGSDVIQAKGLPGVLAPESSGKLIAETILRLLYKEEPL